MKTIPYHLFKNKNIRKSRNSNYQDFYKQLVNMYVNRFIYEKGGNGSLYLYSSQTNNPTEVIESINEQFIYDYLLLNKPECLTIKGKVLSFDEYLYEIGIYFMRINQNLLEGNSITLPHFLGIIKVQISEVKKLNFLTKKILPKKIITLHWEKKYFEKRLLNVVKPEWFSIKIKNKELLLKLYNRIITHEFLYTIYTPVTFSKKIK